MPESSLRTHLRRQLLAHLTALGYTSNRSKPLGTPAPELRRVNPVRGGIAYGETVLHSDLHTRRCRERLLFFSRRRTRQRSSILLFIGVDESDGPALTDLLKELDIRNGTRGGHVQVVPIAPNSRRTTTATAAEAQS